MTIGQRIRHRREELGMSQEDLAHHIGYKSKSSINKIELDVQQLRQSKIKQIADALETTTDYIMGWDERPADADSFPLLPLQHHASAVSIPVLGRVAAGVPIAAVEYIVDTEEITQEMARTGTHYGLVIRGDSMEPRICDGDVVIVRQQSTAESGDIVIALVNGSDATCKRLKKYEDGIALVSFNPAYDPMIFSSKEVESMPVQIVGKVVELRGKFE